jgi:hypothetical protein
MSKKNKEETTDEEVIPTVEPTKVEEPKVEEPKVEEPKVEKPKVEKPEVEKPKAEEPKEEAPKEESPKDKYQEKIEKTFKAYPDMKELYGVGKHVFLTESDAKLHAGAKGKVTTHKRS